MPAGSDSAGRGRDIGQTALFGPSQCSNEELWELGVELGFFPKWDSNPVFQRRMRENDRTSEDRLRVVV